MNRKQLLQKYSAQIGSGEAREITFLANTGKRMADGTTVDLDTLTVRDPDTGELVLVKDLAEGDTKNYVALLTDHAWSIDHKAGQVRNLWLTAEGLMAKAKLAQTETGNNLLALAKDDMLDTFSITVGFQEEPDESGIIHNAQLLEISAVWLGNDEKTKLTAVNERREDMANFVQQNKLTKDEADDLLNGIKAAVDAVTDTSADESIDGGDEPTEDKPVVPATNAHTVNNFITVQRNEREAEAKEEAVKQVITNTTDNSGYLKSARAMHDFAKCIVSYRGNSELAMNAWSQNLKANGITGDMLPTSIEQVLFKTWTDADSILSTFRNSRARMLDHNAFAGEGEDIRAKGHKKGEAKASQNLTLVNRTTRVKGIYKMLPLDLETIVDDTTGEILQFRTEELASRVANEIVVGAILGDGRSSGSPDYRVFDGTKGLYSMAADITASATPETNKYAAAVATQVTAATGESLYKSYRRLLDAVRTNRTRVLVLPYGMVTEILTEEESTTGRPFFAPGTPIETIFPNTRVFELDEMVSADYKANFKGIAYEDQSYTLNGDQTGRVFTDFDISHNQDVMEVVRYVGGSLAGRKVAAGLKEAAA